MNYQDALNILTSLRQTHVLKYWDTLSPAQQKKFLQQVALLDSATLLHQQELLKASKPFKGNVEPLQEFALAGNSVDKQAGQKLMAEGKMGCLIVAGGQGSRLRFEGPKGMYPITPVKHKSLFQLFAEKTLAASQQAGMPLPLAIMTSPLNHSVTLEFFNTHKYFGLAPEQVSFFSQGMLPLLDISGNLFLEATDSIAEGPDGNGSALHHFFRNGLWDTWYKQGIRYLNFIIVDNALADPFDAELLGYQWRTHSDLVIKCTKKLNAEEKVGVLAKENGLIKVIEYSELPEKARQAVNPDGSLQYACANLSLFCFSMDFIKQVVTHPLPLPLHKAFKAVKYLDASGRSVLAQKPMAWKFEKFIFDVLPLAAKVSALLYPRELCFAPLKNDVGEDSAATVQAALQASDRHAIEAVTGKPCLAPNLEASPEFYYPSSQLCQKWRGKQIKASGYIDA